MRLWGAMIFGTMFKGWSIDFVALKVEFITLVLRNFDVELVGMFFFCARNIMPKMRFSFLPSRENWGGRVMFKDILPMI